MSSKKPIALSVKLKTSNNTDKFGRRCIVHYDDYAENAYIRPMTDITFNSITRSVGDRQAQDNIALRLSHICAKVPSNYSPTKHGSHKWCFTNFTNTARMRRKCLRSVESCSELSECRSVCADDTRGDSISESRASSRSSSRCLSSGVSKRILFPADTCLLCDKGPRMRHAYGTYEQLTRCEYKSGERTIKECARERNDSVILGKIDGLDLIAREACYHESCRRDYIRSGPDANADEEAPSVVDEQEAAYCDAFHMLCEYITISIIGDKTAERMAMLLDRYLQYIEDKYPQYYNEKYKTQRLKEQLMQHFGEKLQFWQPKTPSSCLVYSSELQLGEVVEAVVEATCCEAKILREAAAILRRNIEIAHCNSPVMPWPPSCEDLTSGAVAPPESLTVFFTLLLSGKRPSHATDKTSRLSDSISQDVCAAATCGRWKMPKHQLLAMTIKSVTGRADILTLMNRCGHCQSYTSTINMENALGIEAQEVDTVLPSNISSIASFFHRQ